MALQESLSGTQDLSSGLEYSQHTENQRHELQPVDIRSFDECEETCTTIKTFLHLTDVAVLRHEGDTVNFLGLEITKTRTGFEVKNSTDLVESLLSLYGLQNSKPTVNPGRRSTVMELASATPLDAIRHPTTIHTSPQPQLQSKRAVKQLIRYLKGTQRTCLLRLEPREMVQTGLLELVVTQIGPAIRQYTRDIIAMYRT